MIGLARTLGRRVRTPDGRSIGRLQDLSIEFGAAHPCVRLLVLDDRRTLPWSSVVEMDRRGIVVRRAPSAGGREPFGADAPDPHLELLLDRDVLDTQIVDLAGRRVSRVGDVLLAHGRDGRLEVVAAEIGARPVLRRLVPGTRGFERLGTTVDWADLHLTSDRGHEVQLASDTAGMHRLDADGLAHLLTELNLDDAADVVVAVGTRRAAAALARAEHGVAARILMALDPSRARAVLAVLPGPGRDRLADTIGRRSPFTHRRFSRFDGWRRRRHADRGTGPEGAR